MSSHEFLTGYLSALVFWIEISLGTFGLLCIYNVTGGRWGKVIQPFLRWTLPTFIPLFAFFILVLFFLPHLYPWADLAFAHTNVDLQKRLGFMNVEFFSVRTVLYFVAWIFFARGVLKTRTHRRLWSGLALITLLLTISFATIDWIMSVDREWSSTGLGAVAISGCISIGIAFSTVMTIFKSRQDATFTSREQHDPVLLDLGNLQLMAVMLWAYLEFTQYLIIWSGQLPREMHWYQDRSSGVWLSCTLLVALLHFVFPFSALLFRAVKKSPKAMLLISLSVLLSQWLESSIWIAPSAGVAFSTALSTSILFTLIIGAVWFFTFFSHTEELQT